MEEAGILGNSALLEIVLPSFDPGPFPPLSGTPGATTRCQSLIGKSFRAKHIGSVMGVPGRSGSLVGIGAPKLPHRLPPYVHYLEVPQGHFTVLSRSSVGKVSITKSLNRTSC